MGYLKNLWGSGQAASSDTQTETDSLFGLHLIWLKRGENRALRFFQAAAHKERFARIKPFV